MSCNDCCRSLHDYFFPPRNLFIFDYDEIDQLQVDHEPIEIRNNTFFEKISKLFNHKSNNIHYSPLHTNDDGGGGGRSTGININITNGIRNSSEPNHTITPTSTPGRMKEMKLEEIQQDDLQDSLADNLLLPRK